MNRVRATWGGIGVAVLAAVLAAGTAYGELLAKKSLSLEDAINTGQNAAILSFPNVLPREGGIPFVVDGKVVGAIGVSGGKSSEDAQVASAGIDALKK
jgi:glc operon protein GlcG